MIKKRKDGRQKTQKGGNCNEKRKRKKI